MSKALISVFTPLSESGNVTIWETYQSLRDQEKPGPFEWVILPNNGGVVPERIRKWAHVRVIESWSDLNEDEEESFYYNDGEPLWPPQGIGALKRACCAATNGDIYVELDHDDMLAPSALKRIRESFDAGAGFVYSDRAQFTHGTWEPHAFGAEYGWESYDVEFQGHPLKAMRSPPATPQNVRRIEWAPDHVRAWSRDGYWVAGGHNRDMPVADDHDLVVRTLLAGVTITHIPECLYFYREHPRNTVKAQNSQIQALTQKVYDERVYQLAEFFADRSGLRKVDLCGGIDTAPGLEPWDLRNGVDLEKRWPAEDSSVGLIRAQDAIEHLRDPLHTMSEAWRVLAPGGFFLIEVPSTDGRGAWQDPTHVSFWNHNSFWYYTGEQRRYLPPGYESMRFQIARLQTYYPNQWYAVNKIVMVRAHLLAMKDGFKPMGSVDGI
jgi:SAM-dependent methyltransferase